MELGTLVFGVCLLRIVMGCSSVRSDFLKNSFLMSFGLGLFSQALVVMPAHVPAPSA